VDIATGLNEVFRKIFSDDSICVSAKTTANDIDGWDSLAHSVLIVAIETYFKITFSQKELMGFERVGDIMTCIASKTKD
jgi:acyl carrier protein